MARRRRPARVLRVPTGGPRPPGAALSRWEPRQGTEPETEAERVAQASAAAWEAGYQAAQAEAAASAGAREEAERRALRQAIVDAAAAAARDRAAAVETLAGEAAELAVELAGALLARELRVSADVDREALARALRLAPSGEDLVIRLAPGHRLVDADVAAMVPGVSARIVDDPTVERGGCVLHAGACRIDGQIGPALERARAVLAAGGSSESAAA